MATEEQRAELHGAMMGAIIHNDVEIVRELLLEPDLDIDMMYTNQTSLFMYACCKGSFEVIEAFLAANRVFEVNKVDYMGRTVVVHVINDRMDPHILQLLAEDPRVDINRTPNTTWNSLCLCVTVMHHSLEMTKVLLACDRVTGHDWIDYWGNTVYHLAVKHGNDACARLVGRFNKDPAGEMERLKDELGIGKGHKAAELFATIVLVCDDYYEIKE